MFTLRLSLISFNEFNLVYFFPFVLERKIETPSCFPIKEERESLLIWYFFWSITYSFFLFLFFFYFFYFFLSFLHPFIYLITWLIDRLYRFTYESFTIFSNVLKKDQLVRDRMRRERWSLVKHRSFSFSSGSVSKLARTKGWKGWKHYVQVHRSYPICRRGCSVKHGSWSRCTRPTMVLLRALRRLRCSSCLSSDPIVQSFEAKVVPRFFVENAGASESTPSWTFPHMY